MPLRQLADQIVSLSLSGASTPVLVVPTYLSLREQFFAELAGVVSQSTHRGLQVEWLLGGNRGMLRLGSVWKARWLARRMNRRFERLGRIERLGPSGADQRDQRLVSIQLTASIGRPSQTKGPIVLGLANDRDELPRWTVPVRIGGYADPTAHLQLVA